MERLNIKVQQIIKSRLKLNDLSDVFKRHSKKFPDNGPEMVSREKVKLYLRNIRGSIRLKNGRFYTPQEWEDRIKRIKSLKLP